MVHFWPLSITFCAEGYISAKRLKEFLLLSETKKPVVMNEKSDIVMMPVKRIHTPQISIITDEAIVFKDLSAVWTNVCDDSTNGLKSINFSFKHGKAYAIIGTVGSGKSSLLQAILGELQIDSGSLEIYGKISYANQEAFLFEGSIRKNILFTEEYEEKRYSEVVAACGLLKDFEQLDSADLTVVGEKGVSLSGGQKARINLARAIYRQADIYLLDDPLSAVDGDVGHTIFYECIRKFLKDKTVILVTHQLQYLHNIDEIVVLSNGKIEASGTFSELEEMQITNLLHVDNHDEKNKKEDVLIDKVEAKKSTEKEGEAFEEKETQEVGKVSFDVYKNYMKAIKNVPLVIIVLSLRVINQSIASFIDYFVAQWVNWEESVSKNDTTLSQDENIDDGRQFYITVYIVIICSFIFIIFNAEFTFFYALLR
jgi:ABC-type multidrug transport system ATPase subunit